MTGPGEPDLWPTAGKALLVSEDDQGHGVVKGAGARFSGDIALDVIDLHRVVG
jgi:hypothetical protein